MPRARAFQIFIAAIPWGYIVLPAVYYLALTRYMSTAGNFFADTWTVQLFSLMVTCAMAAAVVRIQREQVGQVDPHHAVRTRVLLLAGTILFAGAGIFVNITPVRAATVGLITDFIAADLYPDHSPGKTIYVDRDAIGGADNGTSWTDAYRSLARALSVARAGDIVWVAEGVYYPFYDPNTIMPPMYLFHGVQMYGGFAGGETTLDQRDWEANITVISGDLEQNDVTNGDGVVVNPGNIFGTNAAHVLQLDGTGTPITTDTRIDGFTITAGSAPDQGGAILCNGAGTGSVCSPTLANVIFQGNRSYGRGGALYNDGYDGGNSSPVLMNVTFRNNTAMGDGGAMYSIGSYPSGISSPALTDVVFRENNAGGDGGAFYYECDTCGAGDPNFQSVTFTDNSAAGSGGAFTHRCSVSVSTPRLTDVAFTGNYSAVDGGAIYYEASLSNDCGLALNRVNFEDNRAKERGGAYHGYTTTLAQTTPTFIDVTFHNNSAQSGGAVFNSSFNSEAETPAECASAGVNSPEFQRVTFTDNTSANGGALYNTSECGGGKANPQFIDVEFARNRALAFAGGAVYNKSSEGGQSNPVFNRVKFVDNTAVRGGGAVYSVATTGILFSPDTEVSPTYVAVEFSGNQGGAVYQGCDFTNCTHTFTDSTFQNNHADGDGGAITTTAISNEKYTVSIEIENTTFSGNSAGGNGGALYNRAAGAPTEVKVALRNVTLVDNRADLSGGAIYNNAGTNFNCDTPVTVSPSLVDVEFMGNVAGVNGGAMVNDGECGGVSSPSLHNVTFRDNSAGDDGGALYNNGGNRGTSAPSMNRILFSGNSAASEGGAILNVNAGGRITNALFSRNRASTGGAISSYDSNYWLNNVTFGNNSATSKGGAIFNNNYYATDYPEVVNTIVWGNAAPDGAQIDNLASRPSFEHSLLDGSGGSAAWDSALGDDMGGNIDLDPRFVDAANGDLKLQADSPAIDAADNSACPADDFLGETRPQGDACDMGAYEYTGPTAMLGDVNCNSKVNAQDATIILRHSVGYIAAHNSCDLQSGQMYAPACDVNSNGKCNAQDATIILRCSVGYTNTFCP